MFTHPVANPAPTTPAYTLSPYRSPVDPRCNCAAAALRAHAIPSAGSVAVRCPTAHVATPRQRPPLLTPPARSA